MSRTDEQLFDDFLAGDEGSFALLVQRNLQPVYAFARRMVGDAAAAEDIVQEAFFRAWKHREKYRKSKAPVRTWLFGIARNTAIDWLRARRERVFSDFEEEGDDTSFAETIPDLESLPEDLFAHIEAKEMLDRGLQSLPTAQREVVVLHMQSDLTLEEVARALERPVNTVKSQYRRALKSLRSFFEK